MAVVYFDIKQRFRIIKEEENGDYLIRAKHGHTMKKINTQENKSPEKKEVPQYQ